MKKAIYLILDNIRSRENVGSIFRTADAAGVKKIFLCGITPQPKNFQYQVSSIKPEKPNGPRAFTGYQVGIDKIAKTALGAEKWVPWEYRKQTWRCLLELKSKNKKLKIIALEQTKESIDLFKFKPKFPLALVLGNEVKGLSPQILKYCDKKTAIPMYGRKESLNVAVAAGVALYTIINTDQTLRP